MMDGVQVCTHPSAIVTHHRRLCHSSHGDSTTTATRYCPLKHTIHTIQSTATNAQHKSVLACNLSRRGCVSRASTITLHACVHERGGIVKIFRFLLRHNCKNCFKIENEIQSQSKREHQAQAFFASAAMALSTVLRSSAMVSLGLSALKIAVPATMTLAPASAATSMVLGLSPPSTWMLRLGNFSRSARTCGVEQDNCVSYLLLLLLLLRTQRHRDTETDNQVHIPLASCRA